MGKIVRYIGSNCICPKKCSSPKDLILGKEYGFQEQPAVTVHQDAFGDRRVGNQGFKEGIICTGIDPVATCIQ